MTFASLIRLSSLALVVAVTGLLGGCASPANPMAMVPAQFETGTQHAKSASVEVGGGQATSAMGKSQIGDAEFAAALVEAINRSKTFSKVIQGKGADYLLNVTIVNMDQPSFGFSFTVKMEALWTLRKADGTVVWKEAVKSEHTAKAGDAFAGVERLKLANEGAARNNIAQGLAKIGKLAL